MERAAVCDETVPLFSRLSLLEAILDRLRVRTEAVLAVHPPWDREAGIIRVVEDGDMGQVVAPFHLNADVGPGGALLLGILIALPVGVHCFGAVSRMPRNANKKTADVDLSENDVGPSLAAPTEIEDVLIAGLLHGPVLGFGENGVTGFVKQVVDGLPLDPRPRCADHFGGNAPVIVALPSHEEVAVVDVLEAPENAGLVEVVRRSILGDDAAAVGRHDR